MVHEINIRRPSGLEFRISNKLPIVIIAGPCQMESRDHAMMTAEFISNICRKVGLNFIYKTSFDKANRTSITGKRGIGLDKSLSIFEEIRNSFDCPIITDVHSENQCSIIREVVDILQIPAFLCRQTDLLIAAAKTNKVINVKKGQFLAPWDMENVAHKISSAGNNNIMLTERGVSFGYNRLVNDMRALPIMAKTGYPVVFDATHSIMEPGGEGSSSGGQRKFVPYIARAAVAVGIAAIFIESHQDPENAPSDGASMVRFSDLENLLKQIKDFDQLAKSIQNEG